MKLMPIFLRLDDYLLYANQMATDFREKIRGNREVLRRFYGNSFSPFTIRRESR